MTQPRRSARLAARYQSARSSPPSLPPQPIDRPHGHGAHLRRSSPMTLSSPRSICSLHLHASVMGTSLLLGLSLVASCNVALFPSTCSLSPIWCICLPSPWSAPPATLSPLRFWTSSTSSTCAVSVPITLRLDVVTPLLPVLVLSLGSSAL